MCLVIPEPGRRLACVEQHVADEDPLVRSGEIAFSAFVYLLTGMHLAYVVLEFYSIERGKGAKAALKLFTSWMALLLMLAEDVLVRADEVTLLAVKGIVCFAMHLHDLCSGEEQGAGIVFALHRFNAVHFPDMAQELLAVLSIVATVCLEAAQLLGLCLVGLQMLLQGMAELERLLAHRAGIDI